MFPHRNYTDNPVLLQSACEPLYAELNSLFCEIFSHTAGIFGFSHCYVYFDGALNRSTTEAFTTRFIMMRLIIACVLQLMAAQDVLVCDELATLPAVIVSLFGCWARLIL